MYSVSSRTPSGSSSLTVQLITVSAIILQRTVIHNDLASRNSWNSTYDFIVIGAGSSGAVVAARLTDNPSVNLLLLEVGGPQTVLTDMPALENSLLGDTQEYDWGYVTTPQEGAGLAFTNHSIPYPRGRVIGGSSNLNYMTYNRGNRRDFDNWAENLGCNGWSYDDVMPYFLRSENNTDRRIVKENPRYHSTTGRVSVSSPRNPDPIVLKYIPIAASAGYKYTDLNGPTQNGQMIAQQTINLNATRASTGNAYLESIRGRRNFHLVSRAFVTRILIRNTTSGQQAYGVHFQRHGRYYNVTARKEIIVSAGKHKYVLISILIQDFYIKIVLNHKSNNSLLSLIKVILNIKKTLFYYIII